MTRRALMAAAFGLTAPMWLFAAADNPSTPYAEPDFAYPRQVVATSQKRLDAALAKGDPRATLRALLNLSLAETAISPDNLQVVADRIAELRTRENDPQAAALLDILLAQIYTDTYLADRYKYDQRPVTLDTAPLPLSQWSGARFTDAILGLIDRAMVSAPALARTPVSDYKDVVAIDDQDLALYDPTMLDFVARRCADMLGSLGSRDNLRLAERQRRLLAEMVRATVGNPAENVAWRLALVNFDNSNGRPDPARYAESLSDLFDTTSRLTPASVEVLQQLWSACSSRGDMAMQKRLYGYAADFVKRYPDFFRVNQARTIMASLARKSVTVDAPNTVYPGTTVPVKVSMANTPDGKVTLWRVSDKLSPSARYVSDPSDIKAMQRVADFAVTADGEIPFSATQTLEVPFGTPGRYAISASIGDTPDTPSRTTLAIITCSKLSAFVTTSAARTAYAVDALDGHPLAGIAIDLAPQLRNAATKALGKTDAEGALGISNDLRGFLMAADGTDRSPFVQIWESHPAAGLGNPQYVVDGWTSLALYHPGDTLRWNAVAFKAVGLNRQLLAGKKVEAAVRDANGDTVKQETLTTDEWGRVASACPLPADRLGGTWAVQLKVAGDAPGKYLDTGNIAFEVADYKLPTYELADLKAIPAGAGAYRVTGLARTYSGVPVQDAKVTVDLMSVKPSWWWRSSQQQSFFTAEGATDDSGTFSIALPAAVLEQAPYTKGLFRAAISVVSPAGETESATIGFSAKPLCLITSAVPSVIDTSAPVKLDVEATDLDGKAADTRLAYTLVSADSVTVKQGILPADRTVDWRTVRPGTYTLTVSTPELPESEPLQVDGLICYRPTGAPSPVDTPVWMPATTLVTDPEGSVTVTFGTPEGESHILALLTDVATCKVVKREWITTDGGMAAHTFTLPEDMRKAELTLASVRNFLSANCRADITRPEPKEKIRITSSSIRNLASPLAEETWTFRIEYADSTAAQCAVIADMYAKAMDKIAPAQWSFPQCQGNTAGISLAATRPGNAAFTSSIPPATFKYPPLTEPEWQLWGMSFSPFRSARTMYALAARAKNESGMVMADMGADMMAATPPAAAKGSDESAAEEPDGITAAQQEGADIQYRPSEVPLAFYMPDLLTDPDGSLTLKFTMPNAVTTWQLNMLAFTREVVTADYRRQIVASKPVMVQANLPRFVRTADELTLTATVYNRTEEPVRATLRIEVDDPATPEAATRIEREIEIAANGADTQSCSFRVMSAAGSLLQVRVSARAANHTDGEEALLPVLSSSASVTEATPFFIPADSAFVSVSVPEAPAGAKATLQFCDNPLWLAVLALPSAAQMQPSTSTEAAANLLMAASAKGIFASYPQVVEALQQWSASDKSEQTLQSMLARNDELKQLLLQQTPWMRQATSDSQRMERLAALAEGDNLDRTIAMAVAKLKELQQKDGGLKWTARSDDASEWATMRLLTLAGALKSLGWLLKGGDLDKIVERALKYIDAQTLLHYQKHPKQLYLDYALMRSRFGRPSDPQCRAIIAATVDKVKGGWKKYDATTKAEAALLLAAHSQSAAARDIIASLTEYAESSPERGMWWSGTGIAGQSLILQAYSILKAPQQQVDAVRQWIVFEKEATDWGNNPEVALIVGRLLGSSSSWEQPSGRVAVECNGRPLPVDSKEYATGFFTRPLSLEAGSPTLLKVEREGSAPSWGAVVTQYEREASDVKAHSTRDISIEKVLLVEVPGPDGVKWQPATEIPLGANVKVQLTVKASRTVDYVSIVDERAACLEPVDQLPGVICAEGTCFYRENRDADTRIFIDRLPKGVYMLTYDVTANNAGEYVGGVATVQSQYTPSITAHSAGAIINVAR